jgi:hypothetical protein
MPVVGLILLSPLLQGTQHSLLLMAVTVNILNQKKKKKPHYV